MSLEIIKSGLTKNPSAEYLEEIRQFYLSGTDKKLILVVPDSFSYTAEKRICETVGGSGLNGVEVITFHQLSRKVAGNVSVISSVGKQILVKKAIATCLGDDSIFVRAKDKHGFASEMLGTLSGWKRNQVDESRVLEECKNIKEDSVRRKITDISAVYSEYKKLLEESPCVDGDDELLLAANEILGDESYEGAYVWIDDFTEFAPSELEIIRAFLKQGANVKIYLPINENGDEDGVNNIVCGTYYDIVKMASDNGYNVTSDIVHAEKKIGKDIKFLCENYDGDAVFGEVSKGIHIHKADDPYSETEYVASRIIELVTDKGYGFSDIAVLCGDLNGYSACLETVFDKYNIPYYSDYKVPLSGHPVSILIESVFDIVRNMSFPVKAVDRYLKTGYPAGNGDSVNIITDFVRKRGIKGSMWLNPKYFMTEKESFFSDLMGVEERKIKNTEQLEEIRKTVTEPLVSYGERSKGIKTVKEHIQIFFDFLTDIKLFEKIERRVEILEEEGDENEATRLMHVWNILVDIFNQTVNAAGDETVTRDVFEEYIRAGIDGSEISAIPAVTNGVSVSDTGKRSDSGVRALFLIGATRDTAPKIKREEGIISESETDLFNTIPKTDTVSHYNRRMEFELIHAMGEASEELYISYAFSALDGSKFEPSPLFDTVSRMFPGVKCTDEQWFRERSYISVPEEMLHRLLVKIANDEVLTPAETAAYEWFMESEEYKSAFGLVNEAVSYKTMKGNISKEIAEEIYKNITAYSISGLEKYFKCPFSYFMSYGLRTKEEEEYGIQASDTGTLVHHAATLFCREVEKDAIGFDEKKQRWAELTEERTKEIIDGIFEEYKSASGDDGFINNIIGRVYGTMIRAARMIAVSIKKGKYGISACETDFSGYRLSTEYGTAELRGIIDRIDTFSEDGKEYVRIIDYKTGKKEFKTENVVNGTDLQLMVYAMAAKNCTEGNPVITGMYYNGLKKQIASGKTVSEAENELKKSSKLSGCLIAGTDESGEADIKTGIDMDNDLELTNKSSFLPVEITSKGKYSARSTKFETENVFGKLSRYVEEMITKGVSDIRNGDVRVYPLEKCGVCDYCPYEAVCMYDRQKGAPVNDGERAKEILDMLRSDE